jgi:tRNA 2-thiouridine synthesizing protein D
MKFSIQVSEGPYNHESSVTAINFIKAAIEAGHDIFRVFFYHDGVNNGTNFASPQQEKWPEHHGRFPYLWFRPVDRSRY